MSIIAWILLGLVAERFRHGSGSSGRLAGQRVRADAACVLLPGPQQGRERLGERAQPGDRLLCDWRRSRSGRHRHMARLAQSERTEARRVERLVAPPLVRCDVGRRRHRRDVLSSAPWCQRSDSATRCGTRLDESFPGWQPTPILRAFVSFQAWTRAPSPRHRRRRARCVEALPRRTRVLSRRSGVSALPPRVKAL